METTDHEADRGAPVLAVADLRTAHGAVLAVDGVSLEVRAGEVVGLLGANGAGKSTTIGSLLGLLPIGGGAVARPATVGYAPEQPALWEALDARQHLRALGRLRGLRGAALDDAVTEALVALDLTKLARRPVERLSKGQRQRVGLAAALLGEPEALVLDEPTQGLDPRQARDLRRVVRAAADAGAAVLVSTHLLSEAAALCDRVVLLRDGQVVWSGPPGSAAELERRLLDDEETGDDEEAAEVATGEPGHGLTAAKPHRAGRLAAVRTLAAKDLRALAASPIPYVAAAVLHVGFGLLFVDQLAARGQAVLQPVVPLAGFLLLAVAALVSMRSLAEERRARTVDLLRVRGVGAGTLVVAKWAAAATVCLAALAPLGVAFGLVAAWGDPDHGVALTSALTLAALALVATAVGVAASATTSSQPVAATVAFFALAIGWFAARTPGALGTSPVARLSLSDRARSGASGVLDSGDLPALVLWAAGALALATVVLRARWVARSTRTRLLLPVAAAVGVVVAIAGATSLADAHRHEVDLTQDRTLTLASETKDVLRQLRHPAEVVALLARDDPGRAEAGALLARYERASRRITTRLADPADLPGRLRTAGVDPSTERLVVFGGADGSVVERATTVTEQDITASLARLERGTRPGVCIATGHGEADPTSGAPEGAAGLAALLVRNGYPVDQLDLLGGDAGPVPERCRAVLVLGPTSALPAAAAERFAAALGDQGRLLVAVDPAAAKDPALDIVTAPLGLAFDRGLVLEGDSESRLPDDPTSVVARRFPSQHPVTRVLAPLVLPGVEGVREVPTDGVTTTALVTSTRGSFLERSATGGFRFDDADGPGPITLAAAADRSRVLPDGSGAVRSRLVTVGDSDLFTNGFLQQGDNARFALQAVDWLTADDDALLVRANLGRVRPLALTVDRLRYARLLLAGLVPALCLAAGAAIWLRRRPR